MKEAGPEPAVSTDTLDSWKAIAAYLHRDVRTVMRWERARGLPVHRVPGGGKPGVYALKPELDGWWKRARAPGGVGEEVASHSRAPAVAVLPFANLSADKENEYFSDGLADEIITLLTRIQRLRVTARTSSFAFRDTFQDVREIGARLGVSALLEGSVQRSGGRVRVSAQLVDAKNGFHLWSDCYDREAGDVFLVQDQIAHAIARALEVRLEPSRAPRASANLEAYSQWLKGRHYYYQPRLSRAQIYLGLGETDAVFDWLNRAVEERDPSILDLPGKPIWDVLRNDPRFTALLCKMHLG